MRYLLLLLLLLPVAEVHGRQATEACTDASLKLHVYDQQIIKPLGNVQVKLKNTDFEATTNDRGEVVFQDIDSGLYTLTLVADEAYLSEVLVLRLEPCEDRQLAVGLDRTPIELEGIVVSEERMERTLDRRGFYQRKARGMGRFMTKAELEERNKILLSEALRGVSGVQVISYEGAQVAVSRRRGRTCPLKVFLDGLAMGGFDSSSPQAFDLDSIPLEGTAGIEVYVGTSEIPIQYSQFNQCGVVLVWTE